MKILHQIGAVLGGTLAGFTFVLAVQWISSLIYMMPPGLDPSDFEALSAWMSSLPLGAFLFIIASEAGGCFVGAFVARRLAPNRSTIPGVIVWGLIVLATIFNSFMMPHPAWFPPVSILAGLVMGLLGILAAAPDAYVVRNTQLIKAPVEKVFATLASIDHFSKAVPGIKSIDFISEQHYGVGTRFRETRVMNGKEATTELEVTELVENEHIRIVSEAGGTLWDTVFAVRRADECVEMNMQMDAIPHTFLARVITPMILGVVSKFVGKDMEAVKAYCEQTLD